MNKTPYAIIAGLALTGCMESKPCSNGKPDVRQSVGVNYKSESLTVETVLWVPGSDIWDDGYVVKNRIRDTNVQSDSVEAVKQHQMEQIQPDYESALEFHKKVKRLE